MHDKHIRILAVVATIAAICMYTSYIFQIQANLAGRKGDPIQPLCAAINCTLWVVYGLFKTPRDLPVAIANAPASSSASSPASPVCKHKKTPRNAAFLLASRIILPLPLPYPISAPPVPSRSLAANPRLPHGR